MSNNELFPEFIHLPGWWQRSFFECSKLTETKDYDQLAKVECLMPGMKLEELESISFALAQIQRKILENNPENPLAFDFEVHMRSCSKQQNAASFKRSQQIFPFLTVGSSSGYSFPLFEFSEWKKSKENTLAVLKADQSQKDLIFGMQSVSSMLELSMKNKKYSNALEEHLPVCKVSLPIWLELKTVEKSVLLYLLQLSSDFENWAGLDGEIVVDLHDLASKVHFPKPRGPNPVTHFANMMCYLLRLLNKLADQGWLKTLADDSKYYNFVNKDLNLGFVWQLTSEAQQVMFKSSEEYAANLFAKRIMELNLYEELNAFSFQKIDKKFEINLGELLKKNKLTDFKNLVFVGSEIPNNYYDPVSLFIEIYDRCQSKHVLKLPDWVEHHEVIRRFSNQKEFIPELFEEFVIAVHEDRDFFKKYIAEESTASICKAKPDDFKAFCELKHKQKRQVKLGIRPMSKTIKPMAKKEPSGMSLKLVRAKVTELMEKDKNGFKGLKTKYYDSLSKSERDLILEIQSRMKSHLFESQIKQRLVDFVMKNPDSIQSIAVR